MKREIALKEFGKILKKNHQYFRALYSSSNTSCFRIYDRNSACAPVTVEKYGEFCTIVEFPQGTGENEEETVLVLEENEIVDIASRMLYIPEERIFYKKRPRREGKSQPEIKEKAEITTTVTENGLQFFINLSDYIDTGLFMDHRITREMVRQDAVHKKVLNLFSYTGAFSVYAASGGASETETVDLSSVYLEWAARNMQLNGFIGPAHRFVNSCALEYLKRPVGEHRYDLVILDPPTFSNSRKMEGTFNLQRDYVFLITNAMKRLTSNGAVLFSTNFGGFHLDRGRLKHTDIKDITGLTVPEDFLKKWKPHRAWIIRKKGQDKHK